MNTGKVTRKEEERIKYHEHKENVYFSSIKRSHRRLHYSEARGTRRELRGSLGVDGGGPRPRARAPPAVHRGAVTPSGVSQQVHK